MALLIVEVLDNPISSEFILDEATGTRKLYIEGKYLAAEEKNKNGRIYPMAVLEREVERYTKSHIETNRAYGELNHPPSASIDLSRASHRVVSLHKEGNGFYGKAIVMTETPMGAIVKGILESGGSLGTSSRGLGSLKKNTQGILEVQPDYMLAVAGDIVSDPSGPGCFVNGIMESAEWVYDIASGNWRLAEEMDSIRKEIHATPKSQINEKSIAFFEKFLRKLSNN